METYDASAMAGPPATLILMYKKRLSSLRLERTSWMSHWRELSDYISPRRSRLLYNSISGVNKGWKKNWSIINGKGTWSARVLASGMMAGITSPARPWFELQADDPDLNEFRPVRSYLDFVADRVRRAMLRCNFYKALPLAYLDLGVFGTSCFNLEDDPLTKLRAYSFPIGQYYLANSARGLVDTLYREVKMTIAQIVEKFGMKNVSPMVKMEYDRGNYDLWIDVVHVIEPNTKIEFNVAGSRGMKYRSCWFENSANQRNDPSQQMLASGGFEENPFIATRWMLAAEDVYGSSPGMEALGDIRALQLYEKRKGQIVDKITSPPMRGPSALANQRISLLPGDMTYVDANSPGGTFAPAMEIEPRAMEVLEASCRAHEQRIAEAFYADLWLMLAQNEMTMTATEVAERHEEKMLQLGPVLEQVEDELLDPAVERFIAVLNRNGELPPPPKELQGQELNIEYTSVMAQAQKLVATTGITKLIAFGLNIAPVKPEVMDKINIDLAVEKMADALGVPPEMVNDDATTQKIRSARAQAQQAAMQHQQQMEQADAAAKLGKVNPDNADALKQMLPGAAAAQGNAVGPGSGQTLQ